MAATETDDQGRVWADHPKVPGAKILVSGPSKVRTAEVRAEPAKAKKKPAKKTATKKPEVEG